MPGAINRNLHSYPPVSMCTDYITASSSENAVCIADKSQATSFSLEEILQK